MIKAAQYIRMSTDRQDLSPAIQRAAIASYAAANGFEVVAGYEDLGRSGVRLANRPGLIRLLEDVKAQPDFRAVLVYDVSRWGRFQETDASAYYDYHCRLHGVAVVYVAETFGEGVSPITALVKGMKRVMAAEYSRDLALKCVAGQQRVLAMGYQMGSPPPLGYRRESVSADGLRRVVLLPGQRKIALSDRIRWVLAPDEELALVRRIFDLYAHTNCSTRGLARQAITQGWVNDRGQLLTEAMIAGLLRSEVLIGNFIWGRPTRDSQLRIAKGGYCRHEGAVPRIIDDGTWALVQAKLTSLGWMHHSSTDLLHKLTLALQRNPRLTASDLPAAGCATKQTYCKRFGSWQMALESAGSEPAVVKRNHLFKGKEHRTALHVFGQTLEADLIRRGVSARFNGKFSVLNMRNASIRIMLVWPAVRAGGRRMWKIKSCHCRREVDGVLLVRMETPGPIDFLLVDVEDLRAEFPRWLARELPPALHKHWIRTMPQLQRRLQQEDSRVRRSRGRTRFSADALKRQRDRLGLTARQCAALAGVSLHSIRNWESLLCRPSPRYLEAVARFQRLDKEEAQARLRALIR